MAFAQVGHLSWPIYHLQIYIHVIIACPRRIQLVIPPPLQMSGHRPHPRAANQQITSILKIQCLQPRVVCPLCVLQLPFVRRQLLLSGMPQIYLHPAEQSSEIFLVLMLHHLIIHVTRQSHGTVIHSFIIIPRIPRIFVLVCRSHGHIQLQPGCIFYPVHPVLHSRFSIRLYQHFTFKRQTIRSQFTSNLQHILPHNL